MEASIAPGEMVWQRCPASSTTTRFWPTRFSTSTSLRSSHGISNAPRSSSTTSSRSFGMTGSTSHPRTANDLCTDLAPHDNAWPSGISTSVFAFLRLYELTGKAHYRDRAEHVFRTYGGAAAKNPFGFAHLLACEAPLTSAEALRERFST